MLSRPAQADFASSTHTHTYTHIHTHTHTHTHLRHVSCWMSVEMLLSSFAAAASGTGFFLSNRVLVQPQHTRRSKRVGKGLRGSETPSHTHHTQIRSKAGVIFSQIVILLYLPVGAHRAQHSHISAQHQHHIRFCSGTFISACFVSFYFIVDMQNMQYTYNPFPFLPHLIFILLHTYIPSLLSNIYIYI
jgi:hypothetical protein